MKYNYCCRTCKGEWEAEHSIEDKLSECAHCGGPDIYREAATTSFILKGGRWAYDGYHMNPGEKHVNMGKPTDSEKRAAKKVIEDRKEQAHEARRKAGKRLLQ